MTTRIYLPATVADLAAWHAAGRIPSTEAGYLAPDTSEEGEYAALMSAAEDSLARLAGEPGRRVVVVVEVESAAGEVPLREVVAVHADAEARPADADPDEDLAWFATQEIPDLIDS
ncbi:DUF6912 family protein [Nocardioides insulae]|uniref:DUF6912 family protein n=1 Tax=Nocardioides insulae TaxID=394734 RepID=UPI0004182EBA|nr:hypothetical protein [Nocardioides insulae]